MENQVFLDFGLRFNLRQKKIEKPTIIYAVFMWKGVQVVRTFPDTIVKKSLVIDRIKEKGGKGYWKQELDKIVKLTAEQKKTLGDIKVVSTQKSEFDRMVDNA